MTTRVDEVVVVAHEAGSDRPRLNMVDAERLISVGKPAFAAQAVNAAKLELVAQPGLVIAVVEIAERARAVARGRRGIGKQLGECWNHFPSSRRFSTACSRPLSSSSNSSSQCPSRSSSSA